MGVEEGVSNFIAPRRHVATARTANQHRITLATGWTQNLQAPSGSNELHKFTRITSHRPDHHGTGTWPKWRRQHRQRHRRRRFRAHSHFKAVKRIERAAWPRSDFWSKVHSSGKRSACPVVLLLIGFPMVSVAQAETRIALLVGNQSYSKDIGVLANPHG